MYQFTEKEVEKILTEAFKKGQLWGETYQGWFLPKPQKHIEECEAAISEILADYQ